MTREAIYKMVDFSYLKIAKNLNFYKEARANKEFFEVYRTDKELLKSLGFSIYKKENDVDFSVFDWKLGKGTKEDFEKVELIKKEIENNIVSLHVASALELLLSKGACGFFVEEFKHKMNNKQTQDEVLQECVRAGLDIVEVLKILQENLDKKLNIFEKGVENEK